MHTYITYSDILLYNKCNLLFANFRDKVNFSTTQESDTISQHTMDGFRDLLTYEFIHNVIAPMSVLNNTIYKRVIKHINTKADAMSLIDKITSLYKQYTCKANLGYRIIASDINVDHSVYTTTYTSQIPIVFYTPRNTLSIMYLDNLSGSNPTRNLKFLLDCAVCSNRFNVPVDEYCYLANTQILRETPTLIYYSFKQQQLNNAVLYLDNILKAISYKHYVPNTEYCKKCNFINECKL